MKLKVWNKKIAEKSKDDQLFLRLVNNGDGITLLVVDKKGEKIKKGNILFFDDELKCFVILESLSEETPIKTGYDGTPLIISSDQYKKMKLGHLSERVTGSMPDDLRELLDKIKKEVMSK